MASVAVTPIEVRRTHLELRAADALRPSPAPQLEMTLERVRPISPAQYRALYVLVGERWSWRDRLVWSDAELEAYLSNLAVHVWRLDVGDEIAGYFELQQHSTGAVEVMYFGLVPAFIGRGLGGWLLTRAAEEAFALGARQVILNTCTLDAPQALPNYLARGFMIVREERYVLDVPDRPASSAPTPANQR
jgi:GNAT superfamily N-acetyltransferase